MWIGKSLITNLFPTYEWHNIKYEAKDEIMNVPLISPLNTNLIYTFTNTTTYNIQKLPTRNKWLHNTTLFIVYRNNVVWVSQVLSTW